MKTVQQISSELRKGLRELFYPSGVVSPVPLSPGERVGKTLRNTATTLAEDVAKGTPAALRASPPGQVIEYAQGKTAKYQDLVDALRAIGYLSPVAVGAGAAVGAVKQMGTNIVRRQPVTNNLEEAIPQGISSATPFAALPLLNPFLRDPRWSGPQSGGYTRQLIKTGDNTYKALHLMPDGTKYIGK